MNVNEVKQASDIVLVPCESKPESLETSIQQLILDSSGDHQNQDVTLNKEMEINELLCNHEALENTRCDDNFDLDDAAAAISNAVGEVTDKDVVTDDEIEVDNIPVSEPPEILHPYFVEEIHSKCKSSPLSSSDIQLGDMPDLKSFNNTTEENSSEQFALENSGIELLSSLDSLEDSSAELLIKELDKELLSQQDNQSDVLPEIYSPSEKRLQDLLESSHGEINRLLKQQDKFCLRVKVLSAEREKALMMHDEQCQKLEHWKDLSSKKVEKLTVELKDANEKLSRQDEMAKRTIFQLQEESKSKIQELMTKYGEANKEKEAMVMKYAQGEAKNLEIVSKIQKTEARLKEVLKERELLGDRSKELKVERARATAHIENKNTEIAALRRDIDKQKQLVSGHVVKLQWTQGKLSEEQELRQKASDRIDDLVSLLKKNGNSWAELRVILMDMRESLKEAQNEQRNLSTKQVPKSDSAPHAAALLEAEGVRAALKQLLVELSTWKDKVKALDMERTNQEETLTIFKETLQKQKQGSKELKEQLSEQERLGNDLADAEEKLKELEEEVSLLSRENLDLQTDMQQCTMRESSHLQFSQQLTEKNAKLVAENQSQLSQLKSLREEHEQESKRLTVLELENADMRAEIEELRSSKEDEVNKLQISLQDKTKTIAALLLNVDEEKNEGKCQLRKQAAQIKDLTRQLKNAKKQLDSLSSQQHQLSSPTMGSRTSSSTSLEQPDSSGVHNASETAPPPPSVALAEEEVPTVQVVDKQFLVEKIVKLQKSLARKNEKQEFLEDHVQRLTVENQKKSRIIQGYAISMDAGSVSSESMDLNKAELARKSGIMASLYNSNLKDQGMTMQLSLDINKQLQAVLEDTLLKNITLKDNLQTLGEEIAKLSQENRQIQLKQYSNS